MEFMLQRSGDNMIEILSGKENTAFLDERLFELKNRKNRLCQSSMDVLMLGMLLCIHHSYLQLAGEQQRFIVLYRDPADWMWAVWNFWTHEDDTILNAPEMWAQKSNNYRSPEKFHELFSAGTKSKHFPSRFNTFRAISVSHIRMLWRYAGKENVLLLKNEDMQPRLVNATGGFLDKLSNFTGLDRSLYRDEYVFRISNCSNNKGTQSNCGKKTSSAYDIAGNREMLPKTRELIYLFFWEECKIWAREFGIEYPDCVNVL